MSTAPRPIPVPATGPESPGERSEPHATYGGSRQTNTGDLSASQPNRQRKGGSMSESTGVDETTQAKAGSGRPPKRSLRSRLRWWPYDHLRSFRREDGFPYDQYAWVFSRAYRLAMEQLHKRGRHWTKLTGPDNDILWCQWCGHRESVKQAA